MNLNNQNFQNSLRCLQHPITLLSIVLLLVNDHVLKIVGPSWLTGKLSDFAGLFFFPFIVAAGLGVLLSKFNFTSRHIGLLAFGSVAIWFALLKTLPAINSFTDQFISLLIGSPTQFILDATDLIGLLAIIPSWKLWNQHQIWKPTNLAYVALSIGACAAIATSPREWTVTSVTDLEYSQEGTLYAADKQTFSEESYPVAKSSDGGLTWERDFDREKLPKDEEKVFPIEVCHNLHQFGKTCYRVTSNREFEFLNTSWMKVFPSNGLSIKAYDILIYTWEGKEYMLVAIGEAGVLRRELPDGNWEIIPVINAESW
jgi:hypothetical protein